MKKVKENDVASVYLDDDVMVVRTKKDADLDLDATKELVEMRKDILGGKKMPLLVDSRRMFQVSKEAREYGATKEVTEMITAMAILAGKSVAARLVGNFFINFNKPAVPAKIFKKEENAKKWLRNFKEDHKN